MFKIQQKIVLLSCAIAWTATLILGAIDYRADVTQAEEQSVQILTRQAALIQERLQHSASFFVYDARMISQAAALRQRLQMPPSQSPASFLKAHLRRYL
jgi:hypothetical protein